MTHLIIHCSASTIGDVDTIRSWHLARGWADIGYHYVITGQHPRSSREPPDEQADGAICRGRDEGRDGAHALGYNERSLGVCLVGIDAFTERQLSALVRLCVDRMRAYSIPVEHVLGHCETERAGEKTCPNLDMAEMRERIARRLG